MAQNQQTVAVDIGGTDIRIVVFADPASGTIVARDHFRHSHNQDFASDLQRLIELIKGFAPDTDRIGISIAGIVDGGTITGSSNLAAWHNQPIGERLAEAFDADVRLINDTAAAAQAEVNYGAGLGSEFWFITSGSGLGGALVQADGTVTPQEPGHMTIHADGPTCTCGGPGCWEVYVGGNSLERRYGIASAAELDEAQWSEWCVDMALGLRNLTNVYWTPRVYLGGGVILNEQQRLPVIVERMKQWPYRPVPELCPATKGSDSSLYGALALFR